MAAVALICMTMTSAVLTSCGDDKEDTKTVIYCSKTPLLLEPIYDSCAAIVIRIHFDCYPITT